MRWIPLIIAIGVVAALFLAARGPTAQAQTELPRLSTPVLGQTVGGRFVFTPDRVLIPQVPIILHLTFRNNETNLAIIHTFTINNASTAAPAINSGSVAGNQSVALEFTIRSMNRIEVNGSAFVPEPGTSGILFYCIPHRAAGMQGQIVLATAPPPPAEQGVLLRAYWIGLIAIFVMIFFIGMSYFVIKSSSRRFTDHKEHVKKGLP